MMRVWSKAVAVVGLVSLGALAACESDPAAEAVEERADDKAQMLENQAEMVEEQADAAATEPAEQMLENRAEMLEEKADAVDAAGEAKAERIDDAR